MKRAPAEIRGNDLIIHLDELPNQDHLDTLQNEGHGLYVNYEFADPRKSRPQQRALFFALLGDISLHFVVPKEFLKMMFYTQFNIYTAGKEISLADDSTSSVSDANQLLDLVVDFMFEWRVPFKAGYELLPKDEQFYLYECCRHRICCVCGSEGADIHHFVAVGNRSRQKVDHRKLQFISLCRTHHGEAHNLGGRAFLMKYHLRPIKLSDDDLIRLHIMTRERMDEIDEEATSGYD
ncbi:putative HNHc nuclease [Lentilactobacillus senioris]|uniref:putative HNHc nuclease n=1 Tax=Lentilactobacillus senioris TaxID=931534 RepID=UPI003D286B8D